MPRPTKDDLELRIIELEMLIVGFCADHECSPAEWRQQEHIRPLFEECQRIIKSSQRRISATHRSNSHE